MEKTWKRFVPEKPFEFSFLDESLDRLYREEMRVGQLVGPFALLAILVACMGLFGWLHLPRNSARRRSVCERAHR